MRCFDEWPWYDLAISLGIGVEGRAKASRPGGAYHLRAEPCFRPVLCKDFRLEPNGPRRPTGKFATHWILPLGVEAAQANAPATARPGGVAFVVIAMGLWARLGLLKKTRAVWIVPARAPGNRSRRRAGSGKSACCSGCFAQSSLSGRRESATKIARGVPPRAMSQV